MEASADGACQPATPFRKPKKKVRDVPPVTSRSLLRVSTRMKVRDKIFVAALDFFFP